MNQRLNKPGPGPRSSHRARRIVRDAHALTAYQCAAQVWLTMNTIHSRSYRTHTGNSHLTRKGSPRADMTVERTDLYAVLGLAPQATEAEIRRAYRTLIRQNHPDTRPLDHPADNAASTATLQQAIAAYSVLGDPARRAGYDRGTIGRRAGSPTPVRPARPFTQDTANAPPIQAGPVRWHRSR